MHITSSYIHQASRFAITTRAAALPSSSMMRSTTTSAGSTLMKLASRLPPGFQRTWPVMAGGLTIMTVTYIMIFCLFRQKRPVLGLMALEPADEYCPPRRFPQRASCTRSDLLAFQVTCSLAIYTCAGLGVAAWHWNKRAHTIIPVTSHGRLFGYLPEAEMLAAINLTFQVWDFVVSLFIPEFCTVLFMSHHLLAAVVCWMSLAFDMLNYYGIFFLGLSEVSSCFLVLVDFAKYFPPVSTSSWRSTLNAVVAGPGFAITFLIYRVLLWWPVSFRLLGDVRQVLRDGTLQKLRPGKAGVLYTFCGVNLALGLLQLYWLTIIVNEARQVLTGKEAASEAHGAGPP